MSEEVKKEIDVYFEEAYAIFFRKRKILLHSFSEWTLVKRKGMGKSQSMRMRRTKLPGKCERSIKKMHDACQAKSGGSNICGGLITRPE